MAEKPVSTLTRGTNGDSKPKRERKAAGPLTINGYLIAVLKLRESARPREEKLLLRVPEAQREAARALVAKVGG